MPVATVYIYGNLPVDIEFNNRWEPLSATVHHGVDGVVGLDMTDAELFSLCNNNSDRIREQLQAATPSKAALRSSYREDELKAGNY